ALVEKTEDSKNVFALLYPHLIQSIRTFHMFQVGLGDMLYFSYQVKRPDYFILNLFPLLYKEVMEIILVKNNLPIVFFTHFTKVKQVSLKYNFPQSKTPRIS